MERDSVASMRKVYPSVVWRAKIPNLNSSRAAPKKTGIYVKTCRRVQVESQRGIQIFSICRGLPATIFFLTIYVANI